MTITDVVLVASGVVNVICLFLVFHSYGILQSMKNHVEQFHAGLGNILGRILRIEQGVQRLGDGFTEFINATGNLVEKLDSMNQMKMGQMYRTVDGKYMGASLEDLISKIRRDKAEGQYFSDEELDKLRNLFEDNDDNSFEEEQ